LGLGFLLADVMIGVDFAFFWMTSSVDPMSRFCGSKLYWILGYESLEPLIDFLAFLGPKLWQKIHILGFP